MDLHETVGTRIVATSNRWIDPWIPVLYYGAVHRR